MLGSVRVFYYCFSLLVANTFAILFVFLQSQEQMAEELSQLQPPVDQTNSFSGSTKIQIAIIMISAQQLPRILLN